MTNEELKKYYHGVYRFDETIDGYIYGIQYTKEQSEYLKFNDFFYVRSYYSNAQTIEFTTTATEISFECKFERCENETIELAIDDVIYESKTAKEISKSGTVSFKLCKGNKNVVIYLTADDITYIKNFSINGDVQPIVKNAKVLWMGDSITQGYGPFSSAGTYVSVANRILKYEVLNQGIGGYYFDKNVLIKMPGYTPDKIIIAHGTNQFMMDNRESEVEFYFERLAKIYPNISTLVITPVWRGIIDDNSNLDKTRKLIGFSKKIKEVAEKYNNIKVIDGFKVLHHDKRYFMTDWIHPNSLGCEVYGHNLADEIKKIGF